MNRNEFLATLFMMQFKLRRGYRRTYDYKNVYAYSNPESGEILVGNDFTSNSFHGDYTLALKQITKLMIEIKHSNT